MQAAVRDYLSAGRELCAKVSASLLGLCDQAVEAAHWEALGYFQAMLEKHLGLIERRLLKFTHRHPLSPKLHQPRQQMGIRRHGDAKRKSVDEQANFRAVLRIRAPAGSRDAEDHIGSAAVPAEQQSPRPLNKRIDGDVMAAGEIPQSLG